MDKLIDALRGKDLGFWILVMVLLLSVIAFAGYSIYTGRPLSGVELIVGQLLAFLTLLLNFRYGSSKGSKDKSNLLNQKNDNA